MKFRYRAIALSILAGLAAGNPALAETKWSLFTPFTTNDKPTELYRAFAKDVAAAT